MCAHVQSQMLFLWSCLSSVLRQVVSVDLPAGSLVGQQISVSVSASVTS